jgi:hypothetical protein
MRDENDLFYAFSFSLPPLCPFYEPLALPLDAFAYSVRKMKEWSGGK